jgi:hypothetical protein
MQNIKELRDALAKNYERLEEAYSNQNVTKELQFITKEVTNMTGKFMQSVALEVKTQQHLGIKESIPFMKYNKTSKK